MNNLPGWYGAFEDPSFASTEFIPIQKKEPPKATEITDKIKDLSSRELSPLHNSPLDSSHWYSKINNKIENITKETGNLEAIRNSPHSNTIKGGISGFAGGASTGLILLALLATGTPPGALLLGVILTAGAVGTAFGAVAGKHITVSSLSKGSSCIKEQEKELTKLIINCKSEIKSQLEKEKITQASSIEHLENTSPYDYFLLPENPDLISDRFKQIQFIKDYLKTVDEALDLIDRL